MDRSAFETTGSGPPLAGWRVGSGAPVLLLHGGPGLSYAYLDPLVGELKGGLEVAAYQQRGLAPSSTDGPFRVADHVADVERVLDALGWARAFLVGHSWGGHLALHAALAVPERLHGALVLDPLGGVGDGGNAAFAQELFVRTAENVHQRAREIDELMKRGEGTEELATERMSLLWPAYFADPTGAPPMPVLPLSLACMAATVRSVMEELPRLEAGLPTITVPIRFVHGERSPMPVSASADTAARIRNATLEVVPGSGHFIWLDAPGCVRAALDRLVHSANL